MLNIIFLPDTYIPGQSKHDSLEARGTNLTDISERNAALNRTNGSQTSVIVQENVSPNNNLKKLARKNNSWPQKKIKKIGNSTVGLTKKESSGLEQVTIQSCWKL